MPISQETIELVRSRARIEEVVSRYVPTLKKKGANWVGLCPFHKEKTGSFTVSPDKNMFYCFGCHAGGNVFSFIEKIENLSFPQAVKFLGRLVGIDVRDDDEKRDTTVEECFRINEYAAKIYQAYLMSADGVKGLDYLLGRGVTEEAIQTFRLGYSPDTWEFLTTRITKAGADIAKAGMMGLVGMKEQEGGRVRYYDRYRGRVIFPIIDQYGNVAGFGGRVMGEGEPKYLNSPESQIYKKRNMLYGYNLAKQEIAAMKRAIIVEGYLDVIGCHQAGVRNVVAPLGTALTEEQVKILSRQCEEIVLLFDADSAGLKASIRSLDVVKDINVKAKVATLPEDDPFDFVTKRGVREFLAVVDSALPPVDYLLKQVIENPVDSAMDKLVKAFGIVKEIEYDTERAGYLRKIASALKFDSSTVAADYEKFARNGDRPVQTVLAKKHAERDNYLVRSHCDLLVLVMHYPELIQKAVLDFSSDDFDDPTQKKIFKTLSSFYGDENGLTMDKLFDILKDEDEKKFFTDHITLNFTAENPDAAYTEIYLNIRQHICDRKIAYFADLVKHDTDPEKVRDYLTEIDILRREKEARSTFLYNFKKTPSNG